MPGPHNFLLGHGERLVEAVTLPPGGGSTPLPYTEDEARTRLRPQVREAVQHFSRLPAQACPDGQVVGVLTMHPQFIAKSYHPQRLLDDLGLSYVGARNATVRPEKWTNPSRSPAAAETAELFISGRRAAFTLWAQRMAAGPLPGGDQLRKVESFRAPTPRERQRNMTRLAAGSLVEVGLHLPHRIRSKVLTGFADYVDSLGGTAEVTHALRLQGIAFVPVRLDREALDQLAQFAFARVIRPMPKLRAFHPVERATTATGLKAPALPNTEAVDPEVKMAVLDGGLPEDGPMAPWARSYEAPGIGAAAGDYLDHGHNVTSAALFGPLVPGQTAPRPFGTVDHFRVVDQDPEDGLALYRTLDRVDTVLRENPHELVNLSLGPDLPIEDDEIHPWTALLDSWLSDGKRLLTIAAGNNGALDQPSGNARIQVPSDSVNALSVGAADSTRPSWRRASYSALGPGRCPGMVKPDVLSFGGDHKEPFFFAAPYGQQAPPMSLGTSFAAPSALRMAAGIRAHFGPVLTPLALKALLVHCAEDNEQDTSERGWGRLPTTLEDYVVCPPHTARVVYQGKLAPKQTVRMFLPLPESVTAGNVQITATYCIACPTDPRAPRNYTTSAFEPFFRPHMERLNPSGNVPKSEPFFQARDYMTEQELRADAHKWETVKHKTAVFKADRLKRPAFDVRHVFRLDDLPSDTDPEVSYALVVTLKAPAVPDLYDQVVRTYAARLEILQPVIAIPIPLRP
ncbi:S8 family peptidase [Streptomyces sp. NPDC001351]|uniref:S8 family peptidase n=1 Tax=unclassified Streptomyces TaxID=2593676 RepID=UPI00369364BB